MEEELIILTIIGMAMVTYLPRLIPFMALSGKNMSPAVIVWLRHVPPAVLAAMLLPIILMPEGKITLGFDNLYFWAAIPTLFAAVITKSLFISVIIGMFMVILVRWLGT